MKYNLNINQIKCQEWGLNLQQGAVLSLFTLLSTWADGKEVDGKIYYYLSASKIIDEIPMISKQKRTILLIIKALKDKGLLDHKIIGNRGYYKISELGKTYISDNDITLSSVKKNTHKYEKNYTLGVKKNTHNNNTSNNNTNININIDIKKEKIKESFLLFIENRKQMKAPMTPIAITKMTNKINKWLDIYSEDEVNEWILISIENGWKGLFDKKEKSSAKQEKIKCAYEQDKDFKW